MNANTVTLRPIGGFEWKCPHCYGPNKVHEFTPCVVCAHCGLQADAQVESDVLACLTKQQCQILMLIAEGNTNREISDKMNLSYSAIRNYISEIFDKIRVSNRAEAAALATREMNKEK